MEKVTGCVCSNPGWCDRHNINKSPHFFHLCQTHAGYFKMWEECRGVGQEFMDCAKSAATEPARKVVNKPCGTCNKRPEPEQVEPTPTQEELKQNLPSLFQQAKNFGSALVEHAKNGFQKTPEEQQKERLEICNTCPFLIKESMRCGKCGCFVEAKTKMPMQKCPIDKW